jgi:hypothetical protein
VRDVNYLSRSVTNRNDRIKLFDPHLTRPALCCFDDVSFRILSNFVPLRMPRLWLRKSSNSGRKRPQGIVSTTCKMISKAPHVFAKEAATSVTKSACADPSTQTSILSRFMDSCLSNKRRHSAEALALRVTEKFVWMS